MSLRKIYDKDNTYSALRYIVDLYVYASFRKIRYEGRENLPRDGAVILTPNHCDALMDPMAVLAMDKQAKVFVARADIFQNPVILKILTFLKMLPIHRIRDGFRNVLATEDTVEKSVEVLNNKVPFCILPEGMHRPMHSLLPLGKGVSRIALRTDKVLEGKSHVYIVPIGCEYGDYFRYRSTLLVSIGKPIDISAYIEANSEKSEPELLVGIRDLTAEGIRKEIIYIPDDEDYAPTWELAKLSSGHVPERRLRERMEASRKAIRQVGVLREKAPEKARELFDKVKAFMADRRAARVSLHSVNTRRPLGMALWRTLTVLLSAPVVAVLAAASLPAWGVGEWLARRGQDHAFRNSFRFVALFLLWTLLLIVWAVVLLCNLKWYWALAAIAVLIPAPQWSYHWVEQLRRCASAWRWLANGRLRRKKEELMEAWKVLKTNE